MSDTPQETSTTPAAPTMTRDEALRQADQLYREAAGMMPPASVTVQPARQPDFVNVRLTAAGVTFAGQDGSVHVSNGFMAYTFTGTVAQRVVRLGEWTKVLSLEKTPDGSFLFEIVPETPAAVTPAPATT